MWAVRGGALSQAQPPILGAWGRGLLPTGDGCQRCGRGDPSPIPKRELLRAGFARCGGGTRGPVRGRLLPGCGSSGARRSSTPDRPPLTRPARARHPLGVGAFGMGVRTRHQPHSAHSCALALRAVGAARGRPGEASLAYLLGIRVGRSPMPDRPSFGRAAGARYPLAVGAGGVSVGTRHQTRSTPSCELALRAVGAARGHPGGGRASCLGVGSPGLSLSSAGPPVLGACGRRPLPTSCGCGGHGHGDPSPTPQRALLQVGFAHCEGGTRAPVGQRLSPGCGASGDGRSPTPDRPPLGRAAGARHPLAVGAGGVGVGTRHQPHSVRSCEPGWRAVGRHEGAPRGGRLLPGRGASGVGRSPMPDRPTLGRAAGVHYLLAVGAGSLCVRTRHQPHSARSWELALRAARAARGHTSRGRLLPGCGASGVGRSPTCWPCTWGDPSMTWPPRAR